MAEHWEEALAREFPFMTRVEIDCGDGWYHLLRELCREIAAVYEAAGSPVDIKVKQVKEKYGMLRFYYCPQIPQIDEIVDRYEEQSSCVCDVCGRPGCLHTDLRWHQTLCEEHYEQKKVRI